MLWITVVTVSCLLRLRPPNQSISQDVCTSYYIMYNSYVKDDSKLYSLSIRRALKQTNTVLKQVLPNKSDYRKRRNQITVTCLIISLMPHKLQSLSNFSILKSYYTRHYTTTYFWHYTMTHFWWHTDIILKRYLYYDRFLTTYSTTYSLQHIILWNIWWHTTTYYNTTLFPPHTVLSHSIHETIPPMLISL